MQVGTKHASLYMRALVHSFIHFLYHIIKFSVTGNVGAYLRTPTLDKSQRHHKAETHNTEDARCAISFTFFMY